MSDGIACDWCGVPVPSVHRGWVLGEAAYCPAHALIRGRDPLQVAQKAIDEARQEQGTETASLLRWPWPSLHAMAGFVLPGTITYVAAFPGNGKTSFLARCLTQWIADGFRLYVMPTEARPKHLLTRLAAAAVDVDADEAISLRLKEREEAGDSDAKAARARLFAEFDRLQSTMAQDGPPVFIEPTARLTVSVFREACRAADAMRCDAIIVDHIDHVGADHGSGGNAYGTSEQVQHDALEFAQRFNVPVILMSQLNIRATAGDRLALWRMPSTDWLWMKGVKEQVAATILGLHRVLDPGADSKQLQAVRASMAEPHTVEIPQRMGVAGMKLRHNGGQRGRDVQLSYVRGVLAELAGPDRRAMQSGQDGVLTRPWWDEGAR